MNCSVGTSKLLVVFLLLLFFSCSSDDVTDDPDPEVPEDSNESENEKDPLPHIYISLDDVNAGPNLDESNKRTEFSADLKIDGKEDYDDFEGKMKIRGRGNSTWSMPKKPYKLILEEKASLFGLAPYRKWILLNEYLDGSMLYNSIPFKAGELLGIPYTHNVIPVQVSVNEQFQGVYAFMEHKEVGPDRIDIGEDGLLLEFDAYFDEDWQFYSENYQLPVMVQYPKSKHMDPGKLQEIRSDFEKFEQLIYDDSFPDNDYLDYFDDKSFINYLIVYMLTANEEINHPKSTYINRPAGEKYQMGILWDFDWGFGYESNGSHYLTETATNPLFWNEDHPGTHFFSRFMEDPHMKDLFKERWNRFHKEKLDELIDHIEEYAEIIRPGFEKDHKKWGKRDSSGDLDTDLQKVISWLKARAAYIDTYADSL